VSDGIRRSVHIFSSQEMPTLKYVNGIYIKIGSSLQHTFTKSI